MGEQTGVVRIRGTVGNLTFARTENGDEVRLKTSLNGDKMKKDKRFKRTRENWAEFRNAARAAKLIRNAFSLSTRAIVDSAGHSRLVVDTMKVVKSDPTSQRGSRQIQLGDMNFLYNYEFNIRQQLESTFKQQIDLAIDRAAGTVDLNLPDLIPDVAVATLEGATHFKLVAAVAEVDWQQETYVFDSAETAELVYGPQTEPAQALSLTIPAASTNTILVAFGVFFYQEVNGVFYQLLDGGKNAMAIIGVDHI